MLCGNPDMLDDCEAIGRSRNRQTQEKAPGQIVIERYW